MKSLPIAAFACFVLLSLVAVASDKTTFHVYKEEPPAPEFILIVQDPDSVGTPRHWNRTTGRTKADLMRLELSERGAVRRWEEMLAPVFDGKLHERPIQPWIFGFFGQGESTRYFESDGCVVYSKQLGKSGRINHRLLQSISSQVEFGDFEELCLEREKTTGPPAEAVNGATARPRP